MFKRNRNQYIVDIATRTDRFDEYSSHRGDEGRVEVRIRPRKGKLSHSLIVAEIPANATDFDDRLAAAVSDAENKIAVLTASANSVRTLA